MGASLRWMRPASAPGAERVAGVAFGEGAVEVAVVGTAMVVVEKIARAKEVEAMVAAGMMTIRRGG